MPEGYTPREAYEPQGERKENEEKFHEQAEVNGITISVGWDNSYRKYTIYLPDIDSRVGFEKGIHDQIMILGESPEVAKQVFEKAVELAANSPDVYALYGRIDEFRRGLPDEPEKEAVAEKGPDTSYLEQAVVAGIEMSVGWDDSYRDYTIYFPDISINKEAMDKGVYDQVIRLGKRPEDAKKVFEKAKELAPDVPDAGELFLRIQEFAGDLRRGNEK